MGTKMGNDIHSKSEAYKVGEMILYNGNKTYGYIIQVMDDFVKIVSDQGMITRIRLSDIDKICPMDRKAYARDSIGNILSIDDVVRCQGSSQYKGKKGVIQNICKNCVFLWDAKDFIQSRGIFVETTRNVLILGTEFLEIDSSRAVAG